MLRRLLPFLLAVLGLGAGAGAGHYLRPGGAEAAAGAHGTGTGAAADDAEPDDGAGQDAPAAEGHGAAAGYEAVAASGHDYVKFSNQFVVPVVDKGRVSALVILSLNLEVTAGLTETVYQIEPKLRDAFLQVMFDHANAGGFRGTFTDGSNMVFLRKALLEVAQKVMGPDISDVLIVDLVRQDN